MSYNNAENPVEISIPVPWGHIAGKIWGNSSHQQVLAIHGKQDNCGAFDRLIKLLHMINYIITVVDVIKHLKWHRFHLLTHSIGGQIGMLFNALVPNHVDKFIIIDHIAPSYVEDEYVVEHFKRHFNEFIKMDERLRNGKSPVYSYQVALEKLTNRDSTLTNESAEIILRRSLKEVEGGYNFCMDQRLKLHPFPCVTRNLWNNILLSLNCPTLYIFSTERHAIYRTMFRSSFEVIDKKPNVTIKVAEGNHDLHQNHPERIAPLVDEFFSKEHCKL